MQKIEFIYVFIITNNYSTFLPFWSENHTIFLVSEDESTANSYFLAWSGSSKIILNIYSKKDRFQTICQKKTSHAAPLANLQSKKEIKMLKSFMNQILT